MSSVQEYFSHCGSLKIWQKYYRCMDVSLGMYNTQKLYNLDT